MLRPPPPRHTSPPGSVIQRACPSSSPATRNALLHTGNNFENRRSLLASANGNRKAERPVNAVLNYLFRLVEVEAIIASNAVALDPGLGIVHLDAKGRDSLALDLIEPIRPEIEAFLLDLLADRTFRKADFAETSDGHVRLMSPFTHELAETLPRWAQLVAPWAERVAHLLGDAIAGKYTASTPLTRHRTVDAQAVVKARKAIAQQRAAREPATRQRPASRTSSAPSWSCPECGGAVENRRHIRCAACIAQDPAQTPAIRASRGQAIAARKRALREKGDAGMPEWCDRAWFGQEIRPRLQTMRLVEIMRAAECSKSYASSIRTGRHVPHVSTWRPLAELVGVELSPR